MSVEIEKSGVICVKHNGNAFFKNKHLDACI
jgi:hypothetical protein